MRYTRIFGPACLCLLFACKKNSPTAPVTTTTTQKNLVITANCSVPCNIKVDTAHVNASTYNVFDLQGSFTGYSNSYNAIPGDAIEIFLNSNSVVNPGTMSFTAAYKGKVFLSASNTDAAFLGSSSFAEGKLVPNY